MPERTIEEALNATLYSALIGFLIYSLYSAGDDNSFDNACSAACAPSMSITPIIDMKNQCLCDEGNGKWRFQNVI